MRRYLLVLSFIIFSASVKSQITWDGGGGDGLWSTAANWVGDVVPGPGNSVLLDNSSFAGNYVVTLPNTSVTVISLTISPIAGNVIQLLLPSSNTIQTDAFVTTGSGYTVVIDNGGIFDNNATVSGFTNLTISDSFRINNGGRYIHRTRSGHGTWNEKLARITGTEYGVFEFDVPAGGAYPIATSNSRIYGILELSVNEAGGIQTYTSNAGGVLTVNGDFIINTGATYIYTPPIAGISFVVNGDFTLDPGATFNLCNSGSNTMVFKIKGDIILDGTITELGTSTATTIELNGTVNQQIFGTGSIQNTVIFLMNNPAGATLNSSLTLPYNLTLTNGRITTTSTNLLTMVDNATYTGGSSTSFIDGPMKKVGDENFVFPVGKGSIYAPIGIAGTGGAVTDEFTAEYLRANPQSSTGACPTYCQSGMDHVSYVEYWTLERNAASVATKQVTLDVHATSFCAEIENTYVSQWDPSAPDKWSRESSTFVQTGIVGVLDLGTITTVNPISNFAANRYFTLGTDRPFLNNPLPVTLVDFNVKKYSDQSAIAEWELTDYCFTATKFELEHSTDKTSFAVIAVQPGKENSRLYFYNDTRIARGTNWYRLKITEVDGKITYSKVVAIINDTKGLLITSVYPNPVSNTTNIILSAARSGMTDLQVFDISGTVVYRRRSAIAEGTNNLLLDLGELPAGVYHLSVQSSESKAVYRLVKQ